jgi:hypothetical protein
MGRNKRRHGRATTPVKIAARWAVDTAFDQWQELHPIKSSEKSQNHHQTWQRPAPGWVKANVDASFHAGCHSTASGIALRDQDGRFCGGKTIWYDVCMDALAAEAIACRDGLVYSLNQGVRKLHLEM